MKSMQDGACTYKSQKYFFYPRGGLHDLTNSFIVQLRTKQNWYFGEQPEQNVRYSNIIVSTIAVYCKQKIVRISNN